MALHYDRKSRVSGVANPFDPHTPGLRKGRNPLPVSTDLKLRFQAPRAGCARQCARRCWVDETQRRRLQPHRPFPRLDGSWSSPSSYDHRLFGDLQATWCVATAKANTSASPLARTPDLTCPMLVQVECESRRSSSAQLVCWSGSAARARADLEFGLSFSMGCRGDVIVAAGAVGVSHVA